MATFTFPESTPAPQTPLAQTAFMRDTTPSHNLFNPRTPSLLPVVFEPLLIDTLAHDFKVDPILRANMHAWVERM
ncbi:hypothetical protein HWV62_17852 [Athelia sp. TMB]|nr:hypothetical protein HWV62_17852 [Athelia sp. TMB]